jgi:rhodanese-related sulfurtransferase
LIKTRYRFASVAIFCAFGVLGVFCSDGWSVDTRTYKNISVAQFAKMMDHKDFTLINVHIPYEGEIKGTDLLVPFNEIDRFKNQLPPDKTTKVVVYCLAGPMASIAAEKLVNLGYTQVMQLQGGLMAWRNFGKEVVNRYDGKATSHY